MEKTIKKPVEENEMEVSELFAQCVCHELAHLEGHLFTEIVEEFVEVED